MLAPEEEEFPFRRPSRFRNLERPDHNLLVDPAAMRAAYLEKFNAFCTLLKRACGGDGGGLPQGVDGRTARPNAAGLPGRPISSGAVGALEDAGRWPLTWGLLHWGMLAGMAGSRHPGCHPLPESPSSDGCRLGSDAVPRAGPAFSLEIPAQRAHPPGRPDGCSWA